MKKEDLKINLLIWWNINGYFDKKNCPGLITDVSEQNFKVVTFDNFKEATIILDDKLSPLNQMEICDKNAAKEYLTYTKEKNQVKMDKAKDKIDKSIHYLNLIK